MNEPVLRKTIFGMKFAIDSGDLAAANAAFAAFQKKDYDLSLRNVELNKVREWIDCGANINYGDVEDGTTALMVATIEYSLKDVKRFLSLGGDVNQQDKDGDTVFHHLEYGYKTVAIYVAGGQDDLTSSEMRDQRMLDIAVEFLKYNPDLSLVNNRGKTGLETIRQSPALQGQLQKSMVELLERYVENQTLEAVIESNDVAAGVLF